MKRGPCRPPVVPVAGGSRALPLLLAMLAPLTVVATLVFARDVWLTFALYHVGVCLVAPWLWSRRAGRTWRGHVADLGLSGGGARAGLALGVAAGAAVIAFFALAGDALLAPAQVRATLRGWGVTSATLPALFAVMLAGNGAAEELFWRGWLQTRLAEGRGGAAAVLVAAACYASYHAFTVAALIGGVAATTLLAAAIFSAGCFWGWLRARTGSVWPALLCHAGATTGYMIVLWRRVLAPGA